MNTSAFIDNKLRNLDIQDRLALEQIQGRFPHLVTTTSRRKPTLPLQPETAHHDWEETQNRIEHCIATTDAVDSDGYYAE